MARTPDTSTEVAGHESRLEVVMRTFALVLALFGLAQTARAEAPPAEAPAPVPAPAPTPAEPAPEAASSDDAPLAIPAATPSPGAAAASPRAGGPTAQGGRVAALKSYRKDHLTIRRVSEFYASPGYVTTYGGGWGGRWGGGWGWSVYTPPSVYAQDHWTVFEGEHRLTTPDFLEQVGNTSLASDVQRRIGTNKAIGAVCYAGAGLGLAATVAGFVGMDYANTDYEVNAWGTTALAGIGGIVGGLIGGSLTTNRAHRLEQWPELSVDYDEADASVEEYNDKLRADLGLSVEDAEKAEQAPPQRRRDQD